MWAMMPMLRILSSGVVRGMAILFVSGGRSTLRPWQQKRGATVTPVTGAGLAPLTSGGFRLLDDPGLAPGVSCLPPVVREGPVGLRHPVRVFFLLYGLALALRGEDQLGGEP